MPKINDKTKVFAGIKSDLSVIFCSTKKIKQNINCSLLSDWKLMFVAVKEEIFSIVISIEKHSVFIRKTPLKKLKIS